MATIKVRVSDISGRTLSDTEGALVRIKLAADPTMTWELDATNSEVEKFIQNARAKMTRGRKPAAAKV